MRNPVDAAIVVMRGARHRRRQDRERAGPLRRQPERVGLSLLAGAGALLASTILPALAATANAKQAPVVLAPHRAIYALSLAQTRGVSQLVAVRGGILYDFGGNACKGYSLTFRQVAELDTEEGKAARSDLLATTWESAGGKVFKFNSKNYVNGKLVEAVDGRAEHDATRTLVRLNKPARRTLDLLPIMVFPTEQTIRTIMAARAGRHILDFPVYDGSQSGGAAFDTLTVIGNRIAPGARRPDDAAAGQPRLAGVPRWPVTISYFARTKTAQAGEQTPDYTVSFELYANGISRAISLDYSNYVIFGKLVSLRIKKAEPCP